MKQIIADLEVREEGSPQDQPAPQPEEQLDPAPNVSPETLVSREWLVTNGLGGYASGTLAGVPTRRYHGALIAALPAPLGRMLMLGQVYEVLRLADRRIVRLGGEPQGQQPAAATPPGSGHLREFRLEAGLPIWRYEVDGYHLEKRVFLGHLQNTAYVLYRLTAGPEPLRLEIHPTLHFRPHDAPVSTPLGPPYVLTATEDRYELCSGWPGLPPLRLGLNGANASFTVAGRTLKAVCYELEARRGYESVGDLWSPGFFAADLAPGEETGLVASTESWETLRALQPREALAAELERRERLVAQADPRAREGRPAELVLAADQFVITPGRSEDAARARAAGDEARSVIAGYHWFTDWGRDTMISLEGLTLLTGRQAEAGWILRTFARHVRDGLIPNLFPEGNRDGLYNTADASLWFFHAVDRYLAATGDRSTLELLLPTLQDIIEHHLAGTLFGIHADPADGLLHQGAPGYQLTWMDAKVGDWVVTPRRGKAVEINALWYNALRLLEGWLRQTEDTPEDVLLTTSSTSSTSSASGATVASGAGGAAVLGAGPDRAAPDPDAHHHPDAGHFPAGEPRGVDTSAGPLSVSVPVPAASGPAAARDATPSQQAARIGHLAERARESFNRRFWNAATGCLYDVVDGENGDDPACRPNQIFALSLRHPVLAAERWEAVVETVRRRLLTPLGLRSLAPGEPEYKPTYDGDLRARDAAYHQGTVWAWLIGPFIDAFLRLHPHEAPAAHLLLQGFVPHLGEACLGTISEVFDAEEPFLARGCVAQAWSVAEVLRAWLRTLPPPAEPPAPAGQADPGGWLVEPIPPAVRF
jgi:predicted glycogen debranching enzyme